MKLFNKIRTCIGEDDFRIIIFKDNINIINYDTIIDISNNRIIIKKDKNLLIEGKNLELNKILCNELLIKGDISRITFNE